MDGRGRGGETAANRLWQTRGGGYAALPLGAHALGPFVLHPLALVYAAVGCAMVSKTLRIPKP